MPVLPTELRNKLERVVIEAREAAEEGARAALEALAVHEPKPYPHMSKPQQALRNHLRARARQLGDKQNGSGRIGIDHLVTECAYEHWHRMLFARFLAENDLLIESDDSMVISLAEAEELAKDAGVDVWMYASRCAQRMLPQIFRLDDPLLQVSFATEHMLRLEKLLASLPPAVFTASDALGWVYQFWQSKKKDEVNRSEVKIGADEISAVTQLFTEPYMVEFLLHNTLGAWWAGKKLSAEDAVNAEGEDELRVELALPGIDWSYLRFVQGADGADGPWRPAAGTFDGWPKTASELRLLDPCCGSGHFLVAALYHLVPMRMAEEGLSAGDAVAAVLRDNLHGLEIDERCCQIAAFALALAAWTYPNAGGYRLLPNLHIACTGIGPQCTANQWLKLAEESGAPIGAIAHEPIKASLLNLHRLFSSAPVLGSLVDPADLPADLVAADYETIQPYLQSIMRAEGVSDDETRELAVAATGMARAADILAGRYSLVITNVPYRNRGDLDPVLGQFIDSHFRTARENLGTVFIQRIVKSLMAGGTAALVTPQSWLFLPGYRSLREELLTSYEFNMIAGLGTKSFKTPLWDFAIILLLLSQQPRAREAQTYTAVDIAAESTFEAKAPSLTVTPLEQLVQRRQLGNPDCRIDLHIQTGGPTLANYATFANGIQAGDRPRHVACFWEFPTMSAQWRFLQTTVSKSAHYDGCSLTIRWDSNRDEIPDSAGSVIRGRQAWGRPGVTVSAMGTLPVALYSRERYDENCVTLVPLRSEYLPAIWCFCSSMKYQKEVRKICAALKVRRHLIQVPFNLDEWQTEAKRYAHGLPEQESNDPTQWFFHGTPEESTAPLQVAVARIMGYRWPAEWDNEMRLSERARTLVQQCEKLKQFADRDGIVCIPSVRGEDPAAERLLRLLGASNIESKGDLDDWLRNGFFEEHCKLFHDRPFVWHIWDGRKRDGFHALVSYHKLCEGGGKGRRLLESLTYAYLGDWITRQRDGVKRGEGGAEDRLAAALELQKRLEAILVGEPPFDIFARWKPLAQQAIGWEPDINDGVRMNIRPFLASDLPSGRTGAGILRYKPSIKWGKDRGKEPERPKAQYPWFWGWDEKTQDFMGGKTFDGNRWNDCHYSNKTKQAAREGGSV